MPLTKREKLSEIQRRLDRASALLLAKPTQGILNEAYEETRLALLELQQLIIVEVHRQWT